MRHLGVLLLASVAACEPSPARSRTSVADSSGVTIVSVDLVALGEAARCAVDTPPVFRFGAEATPAELVFGDIASVAMRADGRVAVLDRAARQVRVFERSGALVFVAGRGGEGPAEFGDPIRVIALPGDSLVVWDWGLGRLVVYGPDGAPVRTDAIRPPIANPLAIAFVTQAPRQYWLAGSVVGRLPVGAEVVAQDFALYALDSAMSRRDTVAHLRERTYGWVDERVRQVGSPLFDPRGAVAGNDSLVVVSRGDAPQLEVRDAHWRLRRILRWTEASRAVTPVLATAYRRSFLAQLTRDVDRRAWERTLDRVPIGDSVPTISEVLIGRDGTIAARRFNRLPGTPTEYLLFQPDGRFRCVLVLPSQFRARAIEDDIIAGSETDAAGIPYVVGHRLGRPRR